MAPYLAYMRQDRRFHPVHAVGRIAEWVRLQVRNPLWIGPGEERAQWVDEVARWRSYTPVLVDNIVSTARTMIETIGHFRRAGLAAPVCVAVHPVF